LRRWLVDVEPDRTMRSETYLRAWLLSTVLARDDALDVLAGISGRGRNGARACSG